MLDYRLIEALALVIQENGFEKAAKRLNITQSAISQRIKALEEETGQLLIVRTSPPKLTAAGEKIMKHFHMVTHLEKELESSLDIPGEDSFKKIVIGLNADSLATWFIPACSEFLEKNTNLIEIKVDDQAETDLLLKQGKVMGCISSKSLTFQGCRSILLGKMRYRALAEKSFHAKFFKKGLNEKTVKKVPAVIFNEKDRLHQEFLNLFFEKEIKGFPHHFVPSSEKFMEFIIHGYAYGLVPDLQAMEEIKRGRLKEVSDIYLDIPLFWNFWKIESQIIQNFTETLILNSKRYLI